MNDAEAMKEAIERVLPKLRAVLELLADLTEEQALRVLDAASQVLPATRKGYTVEYITTMMLKVAEAALDAAKEMENAGRPKA